MPTQSEIAYAKKIHSLTFYTPPSDVINNIVTDWDDPGYIGGNPKNTWYDWHLAPTSRPVFTPPKVNSNYLEIPGLSGYLDLTDYFGTTYGSMDGSINFLVMNDYDGEWFERKENIMGYLHGKRLNVVLNDDPSKFYHGRWEVSDWANNNDGSCSSITFTYHLQPQFGLTEGGDFNSG